MNPAPPSIVRYGLQHHQQFLTFACVGGTGFIVDVGVLTALVSGFGADLYAARAVSFALAVTVTWYLNRRATFANRNAGTKRTQYARYFGVQVVGAAINLGIYAFCVESSALMRSFPVLALAAGAIPAMFFTYTASIFYAFRQPPASDTGRQSHATGSPLESSDGTYTGVDNLEVMEAAKNYNRYLLGLVEGTARARDRILDFGAGSGTFARPLAARGHSMVCVEPDAGLRRRLAGLGLIVHADIDEVADRSVDYVYSLNVLEHIEDDAAAAGQIYAKLKPGGRLLIYVPAFESLFTSMDRRVGHLRRYRLKPLVGLLRHAGFEVDSARYVDSLGALATLIYRMVGSDEGTVDSLAIRIYDYMVFPISRVLDLVLSRFVGKNLLIVGRRR
jgi:putative flippase GtrA/SAM-dependent methyltransferase